MTIISQVRSTVGIHFGRDVRRTGGRALDFYASQVVYLTDVGKDKVVIRGQDRVIGVNIIAKVDKNKISQSYRAVDFPILFGYGVDDARSCLNWLAELKALQDFGIRVEEKGRNRDDDNEKDASTGLKKRGPKGAAKAAINRYLENFDHYTPDQRKTEMAELHEIVDRLWWGIERELLPRRKKYE